MDTRNTVALGVRLAGLVIMVWVLLRFCEFFSTALRGMYHFVDVMPFVVATAFLFVVALLLYRAPFKVTNVMIPGTSDTNSRMAARFERTGIALIGLYFLSRGAVDIVYALTLFLHGGLALGFKDVTSGHYLAASVSAVVEISAGLVLVFGSRAIAQFLKRTRQTARPVRT